MDKDIRILKKLLIESFMTCNSNEGGYSVVIKTETLEQAQDLHGIFVDIATSGCAYCGCDFFEGMSFIRDGKKFCHNCIKIVSSGASIGRTF